MRGCNFIGKSVSLLFHSCFHVFSSKLYKVDKKPLKITWPLSISAYVQRRRTEGNHMIMNRFHVLYNRLFARDIGYLTQFLFTLSRCIRDFLNVQNTWVQSTFQILEGIKYFLIPQSTGTKHAKKQYAYTKHAPTSPVYVSQYSIVLRNELSWRHVEICEKMEFRCCWNCVRSVIKSDRTHLGHPKTIRKINILLRGENTE